MLSSSNLKTVNLITTLPGDSVTDRGRESDDNFNQALKLHPSILYSSDFAKHKTSTIAWALSKTSCGSNSTQQFCVQLIWLACCGACRPTFEDARVRRKNGLHGWGFIWMARAHGREEKVRCSLAVGLSGLTAPLPAPCSAAAHWAAVRALNQRGEEPRNWSRERGKGLAVRPEGRTWGVLSVRRRVALWRGDHNLNVDASPRSVFMDKVTWTKRSKTSNLYWPSALPHLTAMCACQARSPCTPNLFWFGCASACQVGE